MKGGKQFSLAREREAGTFPTPQSQKGIKTYRKALVST
jgi:hypothetical protein